eukprot:382427-Hanusia_phi.AAC.1
MFDICNNLFSVISDGHPEVAQLAEHAMVNISSLLRNSEMRALAPAIIASQKAMHTSSSSSASASAAFSEVLDSLLSLEMPSYVDEASLSLLLLPVSRAVRELEAACRRRGVALAGALLTQTRRSSMTGMDREMKRMILDATTDYDPSVREVACLAVARSLLDEQLEPEETRDLLLQRLAHGNLLQRGGAATSLALAMKELRKEELEQLMQDAQLIARAEFVELSPADDGRLKLIDELLVNLDERQKEAAMEDLLKISVSTLRSEEQTLRDASVQTSLALFKECFQVGMRQQDWSLLNSFFNYVCTLLVEFDLNTHVESATIQLLCLCLSHIKQSLELEQEMTRKTAKLHVSPENLLLSKLDERVRDKLTIETFILRHDNNDDVRSGANTVWRFLAGSSIATVFRLVEKIADRIVLLLSSVREEAKDVDEEETEMLTDSKTARCLASVRELANRFANRESNLAGDDLFAKLIRHLQHLDEASSTSTTRKISVMEFAKIVAQEAQHGQLHVLSSQLESVIVANVEDADEMLRMKSISLIKTLASRRVNVTGTVVSDLLGKIFSFSRPTDELSQASGEEKGEDVVDEEGREEDGDEDEESSLIEHMIDAGVRQQISASESYQHFMYFASNAPEVVLPNFFSELDNILNSTSVDPVKVLFLVHQTIKASRSLLVDHIPVVFQGLLTLISTISKHKPAVGAQLEEITNIANHVAVTFTELLMCDEPEATRSVSDMLDESFSLLEGEEDMKVLLALAVFDNLAPVVAKSHKLSSPMKQKRLFTSLVRALFHQSSTISVCADKALNTLRSFVSSSLHHITSLMINEVWKKTAEEKHRLPPPAILTLSSYPIAILLQSSYEEEEEQENEEKEEAARWIVLLIKQVFPPSTSLLPPPSSLLPPSPSSLLLPPPSFLSRPCILFHCPSSVLHPSLLPPPSSLLFFTSTHPRRCSSLPNKFDKQLP